MLLFNLVASNMSGNCYIGAAILPSYVRIVYMISPFVIAATHEPELICRPRIDGEHDLAFFFTCFLTHRLVVGYVPRHHLA
jgi:hypothetical protein